MDSKSALKELENFQQEIDNDFHQKTRSDILLNVLNEKVIELARTCIDETNATNSYDEKVERLVKGLNDVVEIVTSVKNQVNSIILQNNSDQQLLQRIKTRFSDYESLEKKNA